ncbi:MAG: type II secretion system protein [Oscillospiraceae bacterium]|nr:type II secretion system protein [Oscillospiraceae bacterium]
MKKILKGFTLIELIIVMAILVILMSAIMNMFKPIRETYVDATLYENQRTTQNGIIQYVTESVRFSRDMGIYNDTVTSVSGAITAFADEYIDTYAITDSTKADAVRALIEEKVDFIVIDNTTKTYDGEDCNGRVVRRKKGSTSISDDYETDPDEARLALGAAYYGEETYSIGLMATPLTGTLTVTVASTSNYGSRSLSSDSADDIENARTNSTAMSSIDLISTSGSVTCRNLTNDSNFGVDEAGMYDVTKFTKSSTIMGSKTFIIFVNDDLKQELQVAAS